MLKIVIPEDTEKLKQYITALEYLVEKDTTKKDKQIHQANLENLKEELQKRIRSEAKNIVVDFLKWVLRNLLKDKENIIMDFGVYTNIINEYYRLIDLYISKIKYYKQNNINIDNEVILDTLKRILESYKKEYVLFKSYDRDIVFYNDLVSWYEDIPKDLERFIKNLSDKS